MAATLGKGIRRRIGEGNDCSLTKQARTSTGSIEGGRCPVSTSGLVVMARAQATGSPHEEVLLHR